VAEIKFVAKTKKVIIEESALSNSAHNEPAMPIADYSHLNIESLALNLSKALKKPAPKTWLGRWFQSRRIQLDQDRITSLCSYVESIQTANQKVTQAQAELQIAPAILRLIMQGNILKAQHDIELQVREHYDHIQEINDRTESRRLQLDKLSAEIEAIRAKTDGIHAENHLIKALMDKIMSIDMTGDELANVINSLKGRSLDELVSLVEKLEAAKAVGMNRRCF